MGFYGGSGASTSTYEDAQGETVKVSPSNPLPVTIAGGITVELGEDTALSIDGSTVNLTAGTEVALAAGTTVALDAATVAALSGGDGGEVTLADGTVVGLVPGTEVTLADGSTVGIDDTTPIRVQIPSALTVSLSGGTAVAITGPVALAANTVVGIDDSTPIAVSLSGAAEFTLADGATVELADGATVALAPGSTVDVTAASALPVTVGNVAPIPVAIDGPIEVTNADGDTVAVSLADRHVIVDNGSGPVTNANPLHVNVVNGGGGAGASGDIITTGDGDAQLVTIADGPLTVSVSGTPTVTVSGTPSVSVTGTPTVSVSGTPTVNLAAGTEVEVAGGEVTLAANGATVATANPLPVTVVSGGGGGASDTELPTAAALADGTANPTTTTVGADNLVFNGTTWDRQRSANAADAGTGTGVPAAGILGWDGSVYRRVKTDNTGALVTAGSGGGGATTGTTITGSSATALNQIPIPSTDVSSHSVLAITVSATAGVTFELQGSEDNTNWVVLPVYTIGASPMVWATSFGATLGVTVGASVSTRYARLRVAGYGWGNCIPYMTLMPNAKPLATAVITPTGTPLSVSLGSAANSFEGSSGSGLVGVGVLGHDGSAYRRIKTDTTGAVATTSAAASGLVVTGAATNALNQNVIPSTDVSGYASLSLSFSASGNSIVELQGSDDNTNFYTLPMTTSQSSPIVWTTQITPWSLIYNAPVTTRYVRVRVTSYTSGSSVPTLVALPNAMPSVFAVHTPTGTVLDTKIGSTAATADGSFSGAITSTVAGAGILGWDGSAFRRVKVDSTGTLQLGASSPAGLVITGTATSTVGNNPIPSTDVSGYASLTISFSAAANQQYELLGSNDNTNWYAIPYIWPHAPGGGYQYTTSAPIGPQLGVVVSAPIYTRYVRLRLSNYVNGSVVPTMILYPNADPAIGMVLNPPGQSLAVDTELAAASALADSSANPTTSTVGAALSAFDGTNWSRARTSAAATGTTGQGVLGVGTLGYNAGLNQYLRTPATATGALHVATQGSATFGTAKATVATAGTAVQLAANACSSVTIKATAANTGLVYVGASGVAAGTGFDLLPGETVSIDVANTNLVYVNAATSGSTVSYVWVA